MFVCLWCVLSVRVVFVCVCVVCISEWAFVCTCKREWLCVYTRAYVTPCLGPWAWACVILCACIYIYLFLYVRARLCVSLFLHFVCVLACLIARSRACVWECALFKCVCVWVWGVATHKFRLIFSHNNQTWESFLYLFNFRLKNANTNPYFDKIPLKNGIQNTLSLAPHPNWMRTAHWRK